MRNRTKAGLVTIAASAAALGLGATQSFAATTLWNVSGGPSYTAASNATLVLTDATTGTQLTCSSGAAGGSANDGTGVGNPVATIGSTSWNSCTGPLGITFNVAQNGTWNIDASSESNGVVSGTIDNISATLTGTACSASVTGNGVPATYDNSTGVLTVLASASPLAISNVNGCFGLINNGDSSNFAGSYQVSPTISISAAN